MVPIIHVGCLSRSWNQSSLKGECGTKGAIMLLIPCVGNKYRLVAHLHIYAPSYLDPRIRCYNDSETKEAEVVGPD
jgi:hypothetical protein